MSKVTVGGYEPLYTAINTASASTELVAAQTGKKIRVLGMYLTSDVVQVIALRSAATEIASFRITVSTNGNISPIGLPVTDIGWCETARGEALNLVQAAANNADGVLVYVIAD